MELGVHKHVFNALMLELVQIGHTDSKNITLEEQLAIFLYTCVTGLTVRHVVRGSNMEMKRSQSEYPMSLKYVINTCITGILKRWLAYSRAGIFLTSCPSANCP